MDANERPDGSGSTLPAILALLVAINGRGFRPSVDLPQIAERIDELRLILWDRAAA